MHVPARTLTTTALALAAALFFTAHAAAQDRPTLFDGRTLTGWTGNVELWSVEEGAIVGRVAGNLARNEFLISRVPLRDFRLIVEVKLTTNDNNSGIQFRSEKIDENGHPSVKGYQADIGGPDNEFWGMLYHEHGREWLSRNSVGRVVQDSAWNTYEVLAVGHKIQTAVNGVQAVDLDDPEGELAGVIALQLHAGGPMEVRFRNFRLEVDPEPKLKTLDNGRNVYAPAPGSGLTPEAAAAAMTVPDGFFVDLIAGEPRIHQPIAMAWDAKGRLWIAEAHSYPAKRPEGEGLDKILIFEDTDGDGTFETSKTFIEGLNLVSGLEVGHGGVWVGAAPEFMFIPDRDGDDRPDSDPIVLLDGFGTQDTHETLNGFIWGPDGWLYGNQGVFNLANVGKPGAPDSQRTHVTAAVWRYHPVRHEFEIFANGGSNQWGVDFNDLGQAFITTCRSRNGGGPITHMIQGGYYWRQAGAHDYPHAYQVLRASADHGHGLGGAGGSKELYGGHTHAGAMIYLGDDWPADYRDRLYTNNVHGKRVNQEINRRLGSGYTTSHADDDFLFANDYWFMGVNLRYGPDGAVYLIDWYDQQACHHRDIDRWDRTNGRVFRIRYGGLEAAHVDLTAATDAELATMQLRVNDWFVREARKELMHRASQRQIDPAAVATLRSIAVDHPDPTRRLRAAWALQVINGFDDELALRLLEDANEYVRAWAVQLTLEDRNAPSAILTAFTHLAQSDPSPVVRLYLASGLQRLPLAERWPIATALLTHADDARDQNLPLLYWFGIEPLVAADLDRALALAADSAVPLVRRNIYRRMAYEPAGRERLVSLIDTAPTTERRHEAIAAMTVALDGRRNVAPPENYSTVATGLYRSPDVWERRQAEVLAARFGDTSPFPRLRATLADAAAPQAARDHAFDVLTIALDPQLPPILHQLLDDDAFRSRAIRRLAAYSHPDTADHLLRRFAGLSRPDRNAALDTLASRPAPAAALLRAIADGTVPRDELTPFLARQMAGLNDATVTGLLESVWGVNRTASADKRERIEHYKTVYTRSADWMFSPEQGRATFDRICATCHTLHGDGAQVGPDLTGTNRLDLDYLIENIVDPNALIGHDFQLSMVRLKDGRVVSGMIEDAGGPTITLRMQDEQQVTVQRSDIADTQRLPVSLMPEGLLDQLDDEQFQNLIRYLRTDSQVPPAR